MALKKTFNRHSEYALESILEQRLTPLRIELRDWLNEQKEVFTLDKYEDFVSRLSKAVDDDSYLQDQIPLAKKALWNSAKAPETPGIERPETALLWAAALLCYRTLGTATKGTPDGLPYKRNLTSTDLWKQIEKSPYATQELTQHAYYVGDSLRRPDTRFRYGPPGSWFYFHPDENYINVDLLISMISGFEHSRAILFHEIGHSQLTTKFPDANMAIRDRMEEIKKQALEQGKEKAAKKQAELDARGSKVRVVPLPNPTKEQYKELRMLAAEWNLRHRVVDATENDVVNRYAVNRGQELAQDYGYSLNHAGVTVSGFATYVMEREKAQKEGRLTIMDQMAQKLAERKEKLEKTLEEKADRLSDEEKEKIKDAIGRIERNAEARFKNILQAVNLAFYKNNDLFEHSAEGWRKLGVEPDWIRITGTGYGKAPVKNSAKEPDDKSVFPHPDMEYLLELCSGPEGLENLQPQPRDRWYGADYFNSLTDELADKRCKIAEKIWDLYLAEYAKDILQDAEQQIDQQIEQAEKGQQQQKQQGQQNQQGQGQDGQSGDGQGDSQEQGGQDSQPGDAGVNQDGEMVDVDMGDGAGDRQMPDVDTPPETPQGGGAGEDAGAEPEGPEQNGGGSGEEPDDDKGKTLEELQGEAQGGQDDKSQKPGAQGKGDKSKDKNPGQEQGDDPDDQSGQGTGAGAGGDGQPLDFEEIAKGNWEDYSAMVQNLSGPIALVGRMLKKIQEKQLEKYMERSHDLEMLPEDKEIDRLDHDAHRNFIIKNKSGQLVEEFDRHRFRKNKEFTRPTEIDIVLMIDGSHSMNNGRHSNRASALDVALTSSTIIYEAAKQVDANVYVMMWGSANPIILARPGDDRKMIEGKIIAARRGLNSGTDMAHAVTKITNVLSQKNAKSGRYGGYTHMIVISDGDIYDRTASARNLDALYRSSRHFTLDFAIIKAATLADTHKTDMEILAEDMKVLNPAQKITVVNETDKSQVPVAIIGALLDKIRTSGSFTAVPQHKKRKGFQRALGQMHYNDRNKNKKNDNNNGF